MDRNGHAVPFQLIPSSSKRVTDRSPSLERHIRAGQDQEARTPSDSLDSRASTDRGASRLNLSSSTFFAPPRPRSGRHICSHMVANSTDYSEKPTSSVDLDGGGIKTYIGTRRLAAACASHLVGEELLRADRRTESV